MDAMNFLYFIKLALQCKSQFKYMYMQVIQSQMRLISYRSQNIEKEDVEKYIYIIIGGFYDIDNIVLIEVTDPKVYC